MLCELPISDTKEFEPDHWHRRESGIDPVQDDKVVLGQNPDVLITKVGKMPYQTGERVAAVWQYRTVLLVISGDLSVYRGQILLDEYLVHRPASSCSCSRQP